MTQTTALWRKLGDRFTDNSGNALAGGKLFYYQAGTTTLSNTYSDSNGLFANTNPVLLDAAGRNDVPIYITALNNYKELLTDSSGNTITPWPMDNIPAAVAPAVSQVGFASPLITWLQFTTATVTVTPAQAGFGFEGLTTSNSITFNLPAASSIGAGKTLWFKKTSASNIVSIVPNGSDTIDGLNAAYVMTFDNQAIGLSSDGQEWEIISAVQSVAVQPPGGRLTLTTGVPVINADVTAATTVYYTAFAGNSIPVWNGAQFIYWPFSSDLSLTLNSTILGSNGIVDVFAAISGGALVIGVGPAWTTQTAGSCARGTGAGTTQLARQGGLLINAVTITLNNGSTAYSSIPAGEATYLGSLFGDGTAGQISCYLTFGQNRKFAVWNAYNRKPIVIIAGDSTASWTYATNTYRSSNNAAGNTIAAFTGLAEEIATCEFSQSVSGSSVEPVIAIGFNSTTAASGLVGGNGIFTTGAFGASGTELRALYIAPPSLGLNNVNAIEKSASGTVTFDGTNANMQIMVSYLG